MTSGLSALDLSGYLSDLSCAPGDRLTAFVSSTAGDYGARIVALDESAEGTVDEARWGGRADLGRHHGREQTTAIGSCVVVPSPPLLAGSILLQVSVWPTLPVDGRRQGIFSGDAGAGAPAIWLGLDPHGHPEAVVGGEHPARVVCGVALETRQWHRLTLLLDREGGRIVLRCESLSPWSRQEASCEAAWSAPAEFEIEALVLGATTCRGRPVHGHGPLAVGEPFNGKLARPWVATTTTSELPSPVLQREVDERGFTILGASLIAGWSFSERAGAKIRDEGPSGAHGIAVNRPASAVTGPGWDGSEVDFRAVPEQYDALHFHDDDLDDARWAASFEIEVPSGCRSGLYGLALTADSVDDVIPFVVGPAPGAPTADAALWLPTYTYIAYANQRWTSAEAFALEHLSILEEEAIQPGDARLLAHPDWGLSVYDCHRDGSPCRYSSRLRPIADLRPGHRHRHNGLPRGFAADQRFLQWLNQQGRQVDVLTDADLDREGIDAFKPYRAVVSGSHPEYVTYRMHRAVEEFVTGSGHLMYLGGNGLFWVTGVTAESPHLIEVRRGHAGGNPQGDSPPGENNLGSTGEMGGLWRYRGRPPQQVLGVGMSAMGWGRAGGYAWSKASEADAVGFVSAGIDRTVPLGAGTAGFPWGAACDEIDRADPGQGTPSSSVLLASSEGLHDEHYITSPEDTPYGTPEEVARSLVRADMVYLESPRGGRVFSVGSMGWIVAVSHAPDVGRVTLNVLDEFLAAGPEETTRRL